MPIPRIPQWIYYLCPPHPTPSLSFLFHGLCLTYLILAFYTPSCPARSNSNSAPSPLIIIQHPIHISSLPHSLPFSNFILANWAQPSLKTGQDQSNLLLFYKQIPWYLIKVEHATLSKSWVFGSCFLFRVRQHSLQQLDFPYRTCYKIFYKFGRTASFFTTLLVYTSIPTIATINPYPYHSHSTKSDCIKGPIREGVLWGLTLFKSLSLPPRSMDWDNSTLNHWILITQT